MSSVDTPSEWQRIAKSWLSLIIEKSIQPDSVTWSGCAGGNTSCRGSLNHGRRSSPDAEGEGLGSSMNSSILINYP